jgi:hypothetical protein
MQTYPNFIAVDDAHVYWSGPSYVARADKLGASYGLVASSSFQDIRGLVIDDTRAYFMKTGSAPGLYGANKDGTGTPTFLDPGVTNSVYMGLAIDTSGVFTAQTDTGDGGTTVRMTPLDTSSADAGCTVASTAPVASTTVNPIVAGTAYVWFADATQIWRAPKQCGVSQATLFASGTQVSARSLVVDEQYLYWIDKTPGAFAIKRQAQDAPMGAVDDVTSGNASFLTRPGALTISGEYLYYLDAAFSSGGVFRVKKTGGPVEVLTLGQNEPLAIVADDAGSIFWTNGAADVPGAGQVMTMRVAP